MPFLFDRHGGQIIPNGPESTSHGGVYVTIRFDGILLRLFQGDSRTGDPDNMVLDFRVVNRERWHDFLVLLDVIDSRPVPPEGRYYVTFEAAVEVLDSRLGDGLLALRGPSGAGLVAYLDEIIRW